MMSYLSIAVELFYDTTIDVYNIVLKSIASVAVDKPRASCLGMVGGGRLLLNAIFIPTPTSGRTGKGMGIKKSMASLPRINEKKALVGGGG